MPELPPLMRDQRKVDTDNIRLLSIFHFVFAGFALVGIAFLILHFAIMKTVFLNPGMWKAQSGPMPPPQMMTILKIFYGVFGILFLLGGVANLLSGLFLKSRKNRVFSLVVAGINCLQIPLGTILGIFTLITLTRDSVRESYQDRPTPLP